MVQDRNEAGKTTPDESFTSNENGSISKKKPEITNASVEEARTPEENGNLSNGHNPEGSSTTEAGSKQDANEGRPPSAKSSRSIKSSSMSGEKAPSRTPSASSRSSRSAMKDNADDVRPASAVSSRTVDLSTEQQSTSEDSGEKAPSRTPSSKSSRSVVKGTSDEVRPDSVVSARTVDLSAEQQSTNADSGEKVPSRTPSASSRSSKSIKDSTEIRPISAVSSRTVDPSNEEQNSKEYSGEKVPSRTPSASSRSSKSINDNAEIRPSSAISSRTVDPSNEEQNSKEDSGEKLPSRTPSASSRKSSRSAKKDNTDEFLPGSAVSSRTADFSAEQQSLSSATSRPISSTSRKTINSVTEEENKNIGDDGKENRPPSSKSINSVHGVSSGPEAECNGKENRPPSAASRKTIEPSEQEEKSTEKRTPSAASRKSQKAVDEEQTEDHSQENAEKETTDNTNAESKEAKEISEGQGTTEEKPMVQSTESKEEALPSTSDDTIKTGTVSESDVKPTEESQGGKTEENPSASEGKIESTKANVDESSSKQVESATNNSEAQNEPAAEASQVTSTPDVSHPKSTPADVNEESVREGKVAEEPSGSEEIGHTDSQTTKDELTASQTPEITFSGPTPIDFSQGDNTEETATETKNVEDESASEKMNADDATGTSHDAPSASQDKVGEASNEAQNVEEVRQDEQSSAEGEKANFGEEEVSQKEKEISQQEMQSDHEEDEQPSMTEEEASSSLQKAASVEVGYEEDEIDTLLMDQRLPSGVPPGAVPPTASPAVEPVAKKTPEKLSQQEAKQDPLVSCLQKDDDARKNGDIDGDDVIGGKSYPQMDARKEGASKTELDPKKPSSPKTTDSHKITSIQFAEFPLDSSISKTMRDPEVKSDLQRSSTVPEISLRKEPPQETVTVAAIANADVATIATGGTTSLIDWNAENRTLYRNNVEIRSVSNLALHSTIEEEPGYRPDKWDDRSEMMDGVSDSKGKDSSKSETKTVKSTTVSMNGDGHVDFKVKGSLHEALPSKGDLTRTQTASPSHVTVSFPKDCSVSETSASKVEKVTDGVSQSRLIDGPESSLSTLPATSDQIPKEKPSSEKILFEKEDRVTPGPTQKSDELCKQKGQEIQKDISSGEKSPLLKDKDGTPDAAKRDLGPKQDLANGTDKPVVDKAITISGSELRKEEVSSGDSLKAIEAGKASDKVKDDKVPNLEGLPAESSKPIAAVDHTKVLALSSAENTKEKGDIAAAKKENVVSLAEELKSELASAMVLEATMRTVDMQQKKEEKISESKDSKLQPQLLADKSKTAEPSSIPTVPTATPEPGKEHPGELSGKEDDPMMNGIHHRVIWDKVESTPKAVELKQSKDSFNLEQKYSISILASDAHTMEDVSSKGKDVIPHDSVKDTKDEVAAPKGPAVEQEKASPLKAAAPIESADAKVKVVKPEEKDTEMNKIVSPKEISLMETVTTQKMEETTKKPDAIKEESKYVELHPEEKSAEMKLDSSDQKVLEKMDALKRTEASCSDASKEDKQDLKLDQNLAKELDKQIKDKMVVSESEAKKEEAEVPQAAIKEARISTKEPPLAETTSTKALSLEKEEPVQTKDASLEKKQEMAPFPPQQMETASKEKEIVEAFPQQEKIHPLTDTALKKDKTLAETSSSSLTDKAKEAEKLPMMEKLSEIPPETKAEADKLSEEKATVLPTSPSSSLKGAKQEVVAPEKIQDAESPLKSKVEKDDILKGVEKDFKVSDSELQAIKTKVVEGEEKPIKDVEPPPAEKHTSFISKFADEKLSEISVESGKTKIEMPVDEGSKEWKDEGVSPDVSPRKDEKSASQDSAIESVTTKFSPMGTKEVKPGKVEKDDSSPNSSIPEKLLPTEVSKPQVSTTVSQKDSDVRETEPLRDKADISEGKVPATGKEPEPLRMKQEEIEIPKTKTDTLKETAVIQTSRTTSKETEVPLKPLDVSAKTQEVPAKEKEMKQPETKEPSVDKESVLQHKRVESIVTKDNVIDKSKIVSAETELVNELISTKKDSKEEMKEAPTHLPQKLKDDPLKKDKDVLAEPSIPTAEVPKAKAPIETVLPEPVDKKVVSEPSRKVEPEVISLVSRDKDENFDSSVVPSVNKEESKHDGAMIVKVEEERPIQVPKEMVQEKSFVDGGKTGDVISKLPSDVEKPAKETSLHDTNRIGEKKSAINVEKMLPIQASGLVPDISDRENVEKKVEGSKEEIKQIEVSKWETKQVEVSKEDLKQEISKEKRETEVCKEETKSVVSKEETQQVNASKEETKPKVSKEETKQVDVKEETKPKDSKEETEVEVSKEETKQEVTKEETKEVEASKEEAKPEVSKEKAEQVSKEEIKEREIKGETKEVEISEEEVKEEEIKEETKEVEISEEEVKEEEIKEETKEVEVSVEEIKEEEIKEETKEVEVSKEELKQEVSEEETREAEVNKDISDEKDNQDEMATDVKESLGAEEAEQEDAAKEVAEGDKADDICTTPKMEPTVSPKRSKLITKSEEAKPRSVSPHKESKRKVHRRSESRDKADLGISVEKQKEVEKKENDDEKAAHESRQKSPRKRRLRRLYRSAEERESTSVTDSAKVPTSPVKKPSTAPTQKGLTSPKKTPYSRNGLLSPTKSLKGDKKLPPIKAAVGFAPNPNLKNIKSKIGSFDNIHYKPKGGDKKVITAKKLEWNASPKVKSLENTNYRPGGGDKKIITQKLDFKEKAQAKSMDSESDTDAIEVAKGEKKETTEEETPATTTEAQESKEPDSADAMGETTGDQELTA